MRFLPAAVLLAVLRAGLSFADSPPALEQDPLCADPDFFRKDYDQISAVHKKFPQLHAAYESQKKWFDAVSGKMSDACEADKKFASGLIAKPHDQPNGQCAPAEEAAFVDQEVLSHSEASLKMLRSAQKDLLLNGIKGVTEPLSKVADRDVRLVRDYAYTLEEVPFEAFCELRWMYPEGFWRHLGNITGCPALKGFDQPAGEDKKSPSLSARLSTRFNLSIAYKSARRDHAAATALASLARYQACVAQFPDLKPNPQLMGKGGSGPGHPSSAPASSTAVKGSDITGTNQDKDKALP